MTTPSDNAAGPLVPTRLLVVLAGTGLFLVVWTLQSLGADSVYRKDLLQEYLLAKAILEGVDPYMPVT